jgi:hypothetical protein
VEREMMGRRFLEGGAAFFLVTLQSIFTFTKHVRRFSGDVFPDTVI